MHIKALLVGVSLLSAGSAEAGRFVEAGGSAGTSVSITEDGCTASVLFDDARVRGPEDARERMRLRLPLRVVGSSDVSIEARGFSAGAADGAAVLASRFGEDTLFESDGSDDPNWSRELALDSFSGRLWLVLSLFDAEAGQSELAVDTIDLSIADCGADDGR